MYYTHDKKREREEQEQEQEKRRAEMLARQEAQAKEILADDTIIDRCARYGFSFKGGKWAETRTCKYCRYSWDPEVMDAGCMLIWAYNIKTKRNNTNESEVKQDGAND